MLFGSALPVAVAYAQMLAGPGVTRGLIGPAEAARIWERHLLNCAAVAELIPDRCTVADLGSGAGLPGLVLAIMRPRTQVVLIEPMVRRTVFLQECVEQLNLLNVRLVRGRAEDLTGQLDADVVTARAVARLDRLAELAAGLACPGGIVLAIKGIAAAQELAQAASALGRLGATEAELVHAGVGVLAEPTTVIRFRTGIRAAGRQAQRPGRGLNR
jgi:16S rRNA (guanine527-N7)-methyltransferase